MALLQVILSVHNRSAEMLECIRLNERAHIAISACVPQSSFGARVVLVEG